MAIQFSMNSYEINDGEVVNTESMKARRTLNGDTFAAVTYGKTASSDVSNCSSSSTAAGGTCGSVASSLVLYDSPTIAGRCQQLTGKFKNICISRSQERGIIVFHPVMIGVKNISWTNIRQACLRINHGSTVWIQHWKLIKFLRQWKLRLNDDSQSPRGIEPQSITDLFLKKTFCWF